MTSMNAHPSPIIVTAPRQISDTIEEIYGFEVSEGMISDITDKLLPEIENWQNRPLSAVYPVIFIDAVHFSVRDDGIIRKLVAYIMLGIVTKKWETHYPNAMKRWSDNWDVITCIPEFTGFAKGFVFGYI